MISCVADPGDLMAMIVSARTLTWLERRVRAPLLDLKLAFISLRVISSLKAGEMSPLSSTSATWASGAARGMVIT